MRKIFFQNMNSVYRTLNALLTHHMDDKEIGSFNQAPELTGVPLSKKPPPPRPFQGKKVNKLPLSLLLIILH